MTLKVILNNNEEMTYDFPESKWYYEIRLKKQNNISYGYLNTINETDNIMAHKNLIVFFSSLLEKVNLIENVQLYDDEVLLFDSNHLSLNFEHTELAYIQPNRYYKKYLDGLMFVIRFTQEE